MRCYSTSSCILQNTASKINTSKTRESKWIYHWMWVIGGGTGFFNLPLQYSMVAMGKWWRTPFCVEARTHVCMPGMAGGKWPALVSEQGRIAETQTSRILFNELLNDYCAHKGLLTTLPSYRLRCIMIHVTAARSRWISNKWLHI